MDIPLKKIARLLKPDHPAEVRAAAVTVLAELGAKDAEVSAELVERLTDDTGFVRLCAIDAVGRLKVPKALPVLLERIKHGGEEASRSAEAAAKLGAEGVKGLQGLMSNVAPGLRKYIAAALTGAGAAGAEAGVAVLKDKDPQIAAAAATAIVARLPSFSGEQKAVLGKELAALVADKKLRLPVPAELSVIKVLSALDDSSAAAPLWDWTAPPHVTEVRAAALQALGAWIDAPTKDQWKRLFAAAGDTEFAIVARALAILGKLPGAEKHAAEWVKLLDAPDIASRRAAVDRLGDKDSADVAAGLMAQLHHVDRGLRDAARAKLTTLDHGRQALAKALLEAPTPDEAWQLARSLAPFVAKFSTAIRDQIFATAGKYLEDDDHRSDALLFLLREADPSGLRDRLHDGAVARRKKKQYEAAHAFLKPLSRDPAVGVPVRLEMAMVGLKMSDKDVSHESRANDQSLKQFEHAVAHDKAETLAQIEKAKWLEPEDLYYLGFHFVEKFAADKEFGVAVLKLLLKASPKSKPAAAAKNKLKSVAV